MYSVTLSQMISHCGLTLQQISMKCERMGVPVVPSYISKLQTGKQAPPSDKVSEVLAKACGGDPEVLIYEGYLEKAPDFMRNLLRSLADMSREMVRQIAIPSVPEDFRALIETQLNSVSDLELIKQFASDDVKQALSPTMILQDHEDHDVRFIANPLLNLTMPDESMEPRIPANAKLQLSDAKEFHSGDIILVALPDQKYSIRRYISVHDSIILVPESKFFEPILFDPSQMHIVGQVTGVVLNL